VKQGMPFLMIALHKTTIMYAEILLSVVRDLIDPATDQKGNAMAKSHYQFKKRQKELDKKKKKEEKKQRKLENNGVETDETEKDPIPSTEGDFGGL
jgi:HD superfamily phosphohydrolase